MTSRNFRKIISALDITVKSFSMNKFNIIIDGFNHNLKCLLSVRLPFDVPKYSKFGKDFFDDDFIHDKVLQYFDYFRFYSDDFAAWYKQNEEKTWFDLRLGEDGKIYAVAGDSEGIKFLNEVSYIALDYRDYEISFMGSKNGCYWFDFRIDPDGGILKSPCLWNTFDYFDDLNFDSAYYSMKEYSFKAALDDLVAHSDDYQNPIEDEEEEDEEE